MIELLLSARQWLQTFSSGGGIEFIRAFAEKTYGFPPKSRRTAGAEVRMREASPAVNPPLIHRRQGRPTHRHP